MIDLDSTTDMVGSGRTEVVIMILEVANNIRATITKIMHRALHSISKDYLTLPVEHDLLAQVKGNQIFIFTSRLVTDVNSGILLC